MRKLIFIVNMFLRKFLKYVYNLFPIASLQYSKVLVKKKIKKKRRSYK